MRVTPLEIRQKTFEKNFRGYEKDEVNAFLQTLSQEWEKILDETKEYRIRLESSEREVAKLREIESSLFKTLKTAEDTGANVIEQARTSGELYLREAQFKADAMISEAKSKAKDTIEESDMRAKEILAEMEDRLKALVDTYKKIESSRDTLLSELKRLGNDALEHVERTRNNVNAFDPEKHLAMAKRETRRAIFPNLEFELSRKSIVTEKEIVLEEQTMMVETQTRKVSKSFFDEIG